MAGKEKIVLTRDELLAEIAESIRRPEKEEDEFSTYDMMPVFPEKTRAQIRWLLENGVKLGTLKKRSVIVTGRSTVVYKKIGT